MVLRRARVPTAVGVLALVAALLVWRADPASPAGGGLDTSWDTDGAVAVDFGGSGSFDTVNDLVVQTDGKTVVVGDTADGFGLARLTTAGVLDTTFGTGGVVAGSYMSNARGLALQADGKLVLVGRSAETAGDLVVARFTTAGNLDTSFSGNGRVEVTGLTGAGSGGADVAVLTTGTILTLSNDGGALVLHRFTTLGVLDTTFDTDGSATTPASATGAERLAVQSDGAIVLTGSASGSQGVFRLTAAGVADNGFGSSGVATTATHVIRALALQTDNKSITGGDVGTTVLIVRRTTAGALDTTFDGDGIAAFAITGFTDPSVRAVAIQGDGKIVVAGRQDGGAATSSVFVARLTTAGALDPTFGALGVASFSSMSGLDTAQADALAVDASGRYLLGGSVVASRGFTNDNDFVVARVLVTDSPLASTTTSSSSTSTTTTTAPGTIVAGGTGRSDPAGTVPTATNQLVSAVVTPVRGVVSFAEIEPTATAGYRSASAVTITAPAATAAAPLQLTFTIHASSFPTGLPAAAVSVLRDGAPVAPCTGTLVAEPDPCTLSRTRSGDVITVSALTSAASTWTMARPVLERLSGDSRIASAIAASRSMFAANGASAVVLVRSDGFADALAATPLAATKRAPLLLTGSTALADEVLTEITRVLTPGGTVYLLGGDAALGDAVVERIESWGFQTVRYAGENRYETAVVVAEEGLGSPNVAVETTGLGFADALAAGAVAARTGGAVLLTAGAEQSAATEAYLDDHDPATRYALGGPAALADPDATPVVGADRYETAVLAARRFFTSPSVLGVASGRTFPDALSGGTHAALSGAPLLLLPTTGELPVSVSIYLRELAAAPPTAFLYGGTAAVDDTMAGLLRTALGG